MKLALPLDVPTALDKGSKAVQRVTNRETFYPFLVLVFVVGFFGMLYLFRLDWREERLGQQRLYAAMVERLDDIHDHLLDLGSQKTERDHRVEREAKHAADVARQAQIQTTTIGN